MHALLLELQEQEHATRYPDYSDLIEEVNPDGHG